MASQKTITRPSWNGPEISCGKNSQAGQLGRVGRRQRAEHLRAEQLADRVVAEERGEQRADRRQPGDRVGGLRPVRPGRSGRCSACAGSELARPATISEKKTPMDSTMPAFWKVARMPEAAPRMLAGTLDMTSDVFGAANRPPPRPLTKISSREDHVVEVARQEQQAEERDGHHQQAAGGEQARPELVGQVTGERAGGQEADRHGQQVDAGPQRGGLVVVAVQRQPDALQPDDQHELQAAAGDAGQQVGRVARW